MRSTKLAQLAWVVTALALGCSGKGDSSTNNDRGKGGQPTPMPGTAGKGNTTTSGSGAIDDDFGNNQAGTMAPVMVVDASMGVNETVDPDDPKCGGAEFNPEVMREVIPGNILMIVDKSGSMNDPFGDFGAPAKWSSAHDAIKQAIDTLKANVKVGTLFFPDRSGCTGDQRECSCNVPPFATVPPNISFTDGASFLPLWDIAFMGIPDGNTPIAEALQSADQALTDVLPTLSGTTIVVLVTDGAPNCLIDDQAPVAEQSGILTPLPSKWLGMGVKTYAIGLPGADSPNAVAILDAVANAGGTGQHIPASDPATVTTELSKIITESVSSNFENCTIPLSKEPPNLDDVNLLVTMGGMQFSVERDLGASGGWTLDQNAENVILQGQFCDLAKQGEYEGITVIFGCVEVPPLPPPDPPM